MPLKFAVRLYT